MLLHGDELGRTQHGNNNVYCQDGPTAWVDWSLANKNAGLSGFTAGVVALRAAHPVFRRRRFFDGRPIARGSIARSRGGALPDIAWFTPGGEEMAEGDWDSGFGKCVTVFLNGDGITEADTRGERVTDDSFLVCVQRPLRGHRGHAAARATAAPGPSSSTPLRAPSSPCRRPPASPRPTRPCSRAAPPSRCRPARCSSCNASPSPSATWEFRFVAPSSTYRLQFSKDQTFTDAVDLLPYLDTLGVGALYASPLLESGSRLQPRLRRRRPDPGVGGARRRGRPARARGRGAGPGPAVPARHRAQPRRRRRAAGQPVVVGRAAARAGVALRRVLRHRLVEPDPAARPRGGRGEGALRAVAVRRPDRAALLRARGARRARHR